MISTDSTLQIRFTRWRNSVYNKLTILLRKCERSQLSQICLQSVNIRTESESLAEVGRRLSLEKSCGAARLCCLFLNLKIKTLFTKRTRDIGEKVGGSVTYQILRGVTGKDGRGGKAESQRRRRGRKQLQSALKNFSYNNLLSLYTSASAFPASPWAYSGNQSYQLTQMSPWPTPSFSQFHFTITNERIIISSSESLGFRTWTWGEKSLGNYLWSHFFISLTF